MRSIQQLLLAALMSYGASAMAAEPVLTNAEGVVLEQEADTPTSWTENAREILVNALSLTGVRYKFGGNSPQTGFDCSGFVRYVFQQATSLTLPHGARAISQLGQSVALGDLQPGDLVFFNTLKSTFSHVGIYLGNNRFIHAPSSGGGIHVVNMKDSYWAKRFNGARRIDASSADTVRTLQGVNASSAF